MTGDCTPADNHAILAVGWGEGKLPYYKVKNSFGTDWGMNGQILMQRGVAAGVCGKCGILCHTLYPEIPKPKQS